MVDSASLDGLAPRRRRLAPLVVLALVVFAAGAAGYLVFRDTDARPTVAPRPSIERRSPSATPPVNKPQPTAPPATPPPDSDIVRVPDPLTPETGTSGTAPGAADTPAGQTATAPPRPGSAAARPEPTAPPAGAGSRPPITDRPDPPPSVTTADGEAAGSTDLARVRLTLARYESAYNGMDPGRASAVFPDLDRAAFERRRRQQPLHRIALGLCDVTVIENRAETSCAGRARWREQPDSPEQSEARSWSFQLSRARDGSWRIEQVSVR